MVNLVAFVLLELALVAQVCSSHRCAVMQQQCTVALVRAKCIPNVQCCSAKQAHRMLWQCIYTCGDLLCIQACSVATAMHCSTGQGIFNADCSAEKAHRMCWHCIYTCSPLSSAALQNRLTACLCHCNYTQGDLLFTQVCRDATPMHCST